MSSNGGWGRAGKETQNNVQDATIIALANTSWEYSLREVP